jgi:hypothetical protein
MDADARVLVGVVNRWRDWQALEANLWYRIPRARLPQGAEAEVIAFFLSGSAAKQFGASGVYAYARLGGVELHRRIDLIPEESQHPRALAWYYRLHFAEVQRKTPPILNPSAYRIGFIWTTWQRFESACTIGDLWGKKTQIIESDLE